MQTTECCLQLVIFLHTFEMVSPAHAAFWRLRPIIVSSTTMKSFFKLSHSSHLARESSFIISWTALVQNSNFCSCILWRVRLAPGTCASLCVRPCNLARHSVAGDNLNNGSGWQTLIYTHRNFLLIIVSLKIDDTRQNQWLCVIRIRVLEAWNSPLSEPHSPVFFTISSTGSSSSSSSSVFFFLS